MIGVESLNVAAKIEDDIGSPAVDEAQLVVWRRRYEEVENAISRLIREKNLLKIMIGAGSRFVNGDPINNTAYEDERDSSRRKGSVKDTMRDILKEQGCGIRANDMSDELKHRNCAANISYIRVMLRELVTKGLAKNPERGLYVWNIDDE